MMSYLRTHIYMCVSLCIYIYMGMKASPEMRAPESLRQEHDKGMGLRGFRVCGLGFGV